jgi:hypothetical protein
MVPPTVLDRFVEHCPAAVMVRVTLERLLTPTRLDAIFAATATQQDEREILFSELVARMLGLLMELAAELVRLAKGVKLTRYLKKKRGVKKPPPPKTCGKQQPHISTAKILAQSRRR